LSLCIMESESRESRRRDFHKTDRPFRVRERRSVDVE
jgi:hypothetical protein